MMYGLWKAEIMQGTATRSGRPLPWVARLLGTDHRWEFQREFMRGVRDYTLGQEHHTRGVWLYFFLPPGVYEVYRPTSWKHEERYFVRVDEQGDLHQINHEDVLECLKSDISV
jgi:hypothetical protein